MAGYLSVEGRSVLVKVWVVPGASRSELVGPYGRDMLKVRVAAPPEGGRATAEVSTLLAAALGVKVELAAGGASRRKVFRCEPLTLAEAARLLPG